MKLMIRCGWTDPCKTIAKFIVHSIFGAVNIEVYFENYFQVNVTLEKSEFDKKMSKAANQFPWQQFNDSNLRRQFKKLTDIGTNALEDKDQLKLVGILTCRSNMLLVFTCNYFI